MSKKLVLSKEKFLTNITLEFYCGFSDLETNYLEKIYEVKMQQEFLNFAKGIIKLWNLLLLGRILTQDNQAERLVDEFYIVTFFLQYGAQTACNIFSKYFDNFKALGFSNDRSNSTKSCEHQETIQKLEVEVTMKERIIEEEKAKIRNQDERINSLVQKIKKLEKDLLEKDKIIA
jgi:hypothetical protein